jgi:hypothetical protein
MTLAVRKRLVGVKGEDLRRRIVQARVYHVATTALIDLAMSKF